ncbi:MAG: DNA recombination protein RmuC, partial [Verrucomicrobiae bacterium]|nr:DNA recombination protein RmuC [Verrucomicrobiae bacterium]
MEIVGVLIGLVAVGLLVALLIRTRPQPQQPDQSVLMLQQQLNALQQRLDTLSDNVATTLRDSTAQMNTRLDKAAQVVGDLREKVGQIQEIGKAAAELVNILRAPKLRGGMGELFLADLLAQILPPEHYQLQHPFRSGEKVDAVIRIGQRLV